jgi:hypothetical protein
VLLPDSSNQPRLELSSSIVFRRSPSNRSQRCYGGKSMLMHSGAKIKKDDGMGDYKADLTPDMADDWSVDLSYHGPQGPAKLKVPVNVKQ